MGEPIKNVLPSTYGPPTATHNITAGFWFSVVNLILKHVHGIFQTLSLESQYLEIWNEPKQSINTTWQITLMPNSVKRKSLYQKQNGNYTDITNRLNPTQSRSFRFFSASSYIFPLLQLPLFNWSFIMVSRARQATMIVKTAPAFPFIRDVTRGKSWKIEVAQHSFCVRFCWCDSARAQGLQNTNMPSIQRSFYLLNAGTFCAIFLHKWTHCINSFSLLLQRYIIRKGIDAKNPAILGFFFVTERTHAE